MKILWILPYLPWPATSGGKTRQYNLLKTLASRGHRITLLIQSKTDMDPVTRETLQQLVEKVIVVPRRSLRHPLTILGCLFSPYPLLTTINGMAPELTRTFQTLLDETWDIIQIEHSYSAQPYLACMRKRKVNFILTEHNLESSLGGATYGRFPNWAAPFTRFDQWRCRRWESRVFRQAARIMAVTEEDGQAMRRLTDTPVSIVVNGVDTGAFSSVVPSPESKRILFVGNYEYPPNVAAVEWLLDGIAPLVWAEQPEARFAIAGYALPADWPARWSDPRIEWRGFVQDLQALQHQCAAFVAPLQDGGGSKLKVIEALAAALPLVSTSQGVSGLSLREGDSFLGGETSAALARSLLEILDKPQQAAQLGQAGRTYVRQYHDWQVVADQLEHTYRSLLTHKESPYAHRS